MDTRERVVLFTYSMAKDRAQTLLEGLADDTRKPRVERWLREIKGLSSSDRQARLTAAFAERTDAGRRLGVLMGQAPEPLKRELYRSLPPYHRTLFPSPHNAKGEEVGSHSPLLKAFATRLVKEASFG